MFWKIHLVHFVKPSEDVIHKSNYKSKSKQCFNKFTQLKSLLFFKSCATCTLLLFISSFKSPLIHSGCLLLPEHWQRGVKTPFQDLLQCKGSPNILLLNLPLHPLNKPGLQCTAWNRACISTLTGCRLVGIVRGVQFMYMHSEQSSSPAIKLH